MPHPLKLVETIQFTERLAEAMYEAEHAACSLTRWAALPQEARNGWLLSARSVLDFMKVQPVAAPVARRIEAFATRAEVEMTFKRAFLLGVGYGSPGQEDTDAFKEQVTAEARKQAHLWLRAMDRA